MPLGSRTSHCPEKTEFIMREFHYLPLLLLIVISSPCGTREICLLSSEANLSTYDPKLCHCCHLKILTLFFLLKQFEVEADLTCSSPLGWALPWAPLPLRASHSSPSDSDKPWPKRSLRPSPHPAALQGAGACRRLRPPTH